MFLCFCLSLISSRSLPEQLDHKMLHKAISEQQFCAVEDRESSLCHRKEQKWRKRSDRGETAGFPLPLPGLRPKWEPVQVTCVVWHGHLHDRHHHGRAKNDWVKDSSEAASTGNHSLPFLLTKNGTQIYKRHSVSLPSRNYKFNPTFGGLETLRRCKKNLH